ncbi:MAG: hypothetical protein J6K99_07040 [Peptococcaceae bacterium]|nr:hypothetical protein [Peptococcaceae bacterium]
MAIIKYSRGEDGVVRESKSTDGGKTFTDTGANSSNGYKASSSGSGKKSSGNTGTSKYGYSSGNNQYSGKTGKQYNVSGANGAITVNRPDGTSKTVQRGDADYNATLEAMQKDGVDYTPNTTYTNQNGTYTAKSYTAGNKDLQYALEQAAKNSSNGSVSLDDYVESLYNRVGSQRADGSTVSLQNVTDELTRLGLNDYLPGNAIYTAGGNLLPGNEFVAYKDNNGQTTNSEDSRWASYGGQDYLVGGDSSNYANYVNAMTGNYDNLDYIFGGANMANNPYAQANPEFLAQFNNQLAALYAQAGANGINGANGVTGNANTAGSAVSGNVNTNIGNNYSNDSLGGYVSSLGNLGGATGNNGYTSDLWNQIQALLQGGYDATNQFLNSQQVTAEKNAEDLARQAWVNSQLQGDYVREGLSAAGLGATGALQSAQLGVQNNFNNSLANINSNLNDMTTNLSEQKLAALTDYNNNLANYAYQIQNDEADRAYQNAQLAMQQQEYQNALQQQQWENAYQQQLLELQNQQYADSVAQQQSETDYERKAQQAEYYANLYNIGQISGAQYQQYLRSLGLI